MAPPLQSSGQAIQAADGESIDDALAELGEMQCPEGVDEELWGELKGALGEALNSRAETIISGAGVSPANHLNHGRDARATSGVPEDRVNDLSLADHFDATYTLTWRYQNLGDYDQNGMVGISDITPLAIHYGEEVPTEDTDRNSIQAVVDGSGNNKVDIADITPIAMYYGTCCAQYSIRSASSYPESIEDTSEVGAAPVALAEGDDRKVFSVEISEEPRTYIAVAAMDADEVPGELSNVLIIPNHPPVAQLTAEPTEGEVPLQVSFDASGSSDIDGPIAKYEWDWEGDGVYDHDSGIVAEAEHTYDVADYYDPQVRVTDEHNGTDTASVTVTAGRWRIVVAVDDVYGSEPLLTCLEVVNGHPAISLHCFIDLEPEGFWYVRANDADGTTWGSPVLVDDPRQIQNLCGDSSLLVVNGNPALAYVNEDDQELWYARANDADGSAWGTPQMVRDMNTPERNILSMAIVNGHPAIAYEGNVSKVWYVRALDPNGDSWGSPIAASPSYGRVPSLLVVNGAPAICYRYSDDLLYVRANDLNGDTWGEEVTVGNEYYANWWSSMAIVNGKPAICYKEDNNDDLMYVRALDPNGNSWGTPLILDSEGDVGGMCSLAVIHGYPAISYQNFTNDNDSVKYVKATDADGSNWQAPVIVDDNNVGSGYPSLDVVNGHPAISYVTDTELRFAIYY